MKKYLLPCACGKEIEVDSTQSGLKVRCACGVELDVPTMRGLQQLRVAGSTDDEAAVRQSAWGPRQGLLFLAAVVLLVAVPWTAYVQYRLKPVIDYKLPALRSAIEKLTPAESWMLWGEVQKGLFVDQQLDEEYQKALSIYYRNLALGLVASGIGVLLAIAAFFVTPAKRGPPPPARPKPTAGTKAAT